MKTINTVVRTYPRSYNITTENLSQYLNKGWKVIMCTPFTKNGNTEYLEYILESPNQT